MTETPELIGMAGDSLREAFGKALSEMGEFYPEFVVLDADIAGGTGTHHFRKSHPHRFYQCGIAEQNMMAMAGGMAAVGIPVFATTFAVFCLRALEQIRLSIAYSRRNVKIVASHPGLDVGPDGASAQCLEDLAAFRAVPGMTVLSPADPTEVARATRALLEHQGPVYMRTGRSPARRLPGTDEPFKIGQATVLAHGRDVTIVACGNMVAQSLDAASELEREGISAQVVNMATIKPIDEKKILECARKTGCFVTAEDHNILGGLGSAVCEVLARNHPCPVELIGVPDCFGESGEPEDLFKKYRMSAPGIATAAKKVFIRKR